MATEKMKARIEAFKLDMKRAQEKGIDILPSVDGPYAYDRKTARVLGRKGSDGYRCAVAETVLENPKLKTCVQTRDINNPAHTKGDQIP